MKTMLLFLFVSLWFGGISGGQTTVIKKNPVVTISTDLGEIKVRLFDETPLHRDNFLKLAGEGFYDSVLFHRVINHFMIQGGDLASKKAEPGIMLGNGDPGYTLPAEIIPGLFHKKGAIAAARTGDQVNPEKRSSGSQFYIVQGKIWRAGELDTLEMKNNNTLLQSVYQKVFAPAQEELNKYKTENNREAFEKRVAVLQAKGDSIFKTTPKVMYSAQQRVAYTTVGGTPHLDGGYTVFGEVIEGLEVVDKIAAVETDQANRPKNDIKMIIKVAE